MEHSQYKTYLYDGHGHSTASDGIHEPELILDIGIQKGLQIIGLSDHNVITNLPRFLAHADKINKDGIKILPIPSVEMSTAKGDMLVAIPDRHKAENFLSNYKKPDKRAYPLEIIEDYISSYNAIIIFLHPETPYVNCFSLTYIEEMLTKIPKHFHKNMGIEVYNWMMQAFFWTRKWKEAKIHQRNHNFHLAPFSFTDYHSAYHIGNGSTAIYMPQLDSESFIDAIQHRHTAPYTTSSRTLSESLETIGISLVVEGISRFSKRDFHVPR